MSSLQEEMGICLSYRNLEKTFKIEKDTLFDPTIFKMGFQFSHQIPSSNSHGPDTYKTFTLISKGEREGEFIFSVKSYQLPKKAGLVLQPPPPPPLLQRVKVIETAPPPMIYNPPVQLTQQQVIQETPTYQFEDFQREFFNKFNVDMLNVKGPCRTTWSSRRSWIFEPCK